MLAWSKSSQEKADNILPLANEPLGGNNAQSLDLTTEKNWEAVGEDVQKAEALWTLNTTVNHISSRVCALQ